MAPSFSRRLQRELLIVYAALIILGSLHPWTGWQSQAVQPLAFLAAGLPRHLNSFDVLSNLFAYVPLGVLAAGSGPAGALAALGASVLTGTCLSFALESLQGYLPTRVPSNLDLALNALGTLAGALLALLLRGRRAAAIGPMQALRATPQAAHGLVVLGLWLLAQLSPQTLLFGTGDLRGMIGPLTAAPYPPHLFMALEALAVAANTLVIGLVLRSVLLPGAAQARAVAALLLAALALRTLAFAVLFRPADALNWLTPGAILGLAGGLAVLVLAARGLIPVPREGVPRTALAALLVVLAATAVNLGPQNPYWVDALSGWRQGPFLNFNGLSRAVSVLWPLAALLHLLGGLRRAPA